jgi:hypothetical protein
MMRRRSFLFGAILAGIAVAGLAPPARAQSLDFELNVPGSGTISYAGGAAPLIGSGIGSLDVTGLSTPANAGVKELIQGGVLDFTTGAHSSSTATSDNFSGGGTVTLKGGVSSLGIAAGTTLLSGTFVNATVSTFIGNVALTVAVISDHVDATLAAFYGLPGGPTWPYSGGFNLTINLASGSVGNGAGFSGSGGSGDLQTFPLPEPGSLAMAGIGLFTLGAYRLRRRKSA